MIVSFYSYKGGVGRTQLCANIATYLYRFKKKRILVWDWDFEAPGLHYFFEKRTSEINCNGTLEILEDYVQTMRKNPRVKVEDLKFISEKNITSLRTSETGNECIDLLSAGNYGNEFSFRSANFDWFEFYSMLDGIGYVELLKLQISALGYDYILIDSRTGIADYSGICNTQLPDLNIMVIAPTMQNYEGCQSIIEKIANSEYLKIKNRRPKILPILSRIDLSGPEYNKWTNDFCDKFHHLILNLDQKLDSEYLSEIFSDVFCEGTRLPYTTAISAGENIFTELKQINKSSFRRPYLNIAEYIEEINLTQGIDFYKQIDEKTWMEFLKLAVGNPRKVAIANFQIGIKQNSEDEQILYFMQAVAADPTYQEATNRLKKEYSIDKIEVALSRLTANSSEQVEEKKQQRWYKKNASAIYLVTSAMIALFTLIIVFNHHRPDQKPIHLESTKKLLANLSIYDTSYFNNPVINGTPYFDTIRSQGKPIGVDFGFNSTIYDRSKLKQLGVSFAVLKATQGDFSDPNFKNSWQIAKTAVFLRGAYHTYRLQTGAATQADNFIKSVKLSAKDLPPIIDLRGVSVKAMRSKTTGKEINEFINRINIYFGVKPIIFADNDFVSTFERELNSKYLLWINQPNSGLLRPKITEENTKWQLWQFSTKEPIDGISIQRATHTQNNAYAVGINQFNGNNKDLIAMTISNCSGRKALEKAYSILYNNSLEPYGVEMRPLSNNYLTSHSGTRKLSQSTIGSYNLTFNWNVELINHAFSQLNNKHYYGKSMQELLDTLNIQKYVTKNKVGLQIGDIVFYDFGSPNIEACGIVYNYNQEFVYTVEAGDGNGHKKLRCVTRHRGDIRAYAHIP